MTVVAVVVRLVEVSSAVVDGIDEVEVTCVEEVLALGEPEIIKK